MAIVPTSTQTDTDKVRRDFDYRLIRVPKNNIHSTFLPYIYIYIVCYAVNHSKINDNKYDENE